MRIAESAAQYIHREPGRPVDGEGPPRGRKRTRPGSRAARRRQFARVPVSLPVIGRAPQFRGMLLHGMVRSVGAGGLMVEFPVALVRDSILRVTLQTAFGPLEIEGRVVWTAVRRGAIRHGVAFAEPKSSHLAVEPQDAESRSEGRTVLRADDRR